MTPQQRRETTKTKREGKGTCGIRGEVWQRDGARREVGREGSRRGEDSLDKEIDR